MDGNGVVETLRKLDFNQCLADPCVLRRRVDWVVVLMIATHVDDALIAEKNTDIDWLPEALLKVFQTNPGDNLAWHTARVHKRDKVGGTL